MLISTLSPDSSIPGHTLVHFRYQKKFQSLPPLVFKFVFKNYKTIAIYYVFILRWD